MQAVNGKKHETDLYHYKISGLPNIWLKGGVIREETPYGPAIAIKDLDGLHRVIAYSLVRKSAPLTGREARFLRIELDLSQHRLGSMLHTTGQAVARWEKGLTKNARSLDPALRMLWLASVKSRNVAGIIERIADSGNEMTGREIVFTREGNHKWHQQVS